MMDDGESSTCRGRRDVVDRPLDADQLSTSPARSRPVADDESYVVEADEARCHNNAVRDGLYRQNSHRGYCHKQIIALRYLKKPKVEIITRRLCRPMPPTSQPLLRVHAHVSLSHSEAIASFSALLFGGILSRI